MVQAPSTQQQIQQQIENQQHQEQHIQQLPQPPQQLLQQDHQSDQQNELHDPFQHATLEIIDTKDGIVKLNTHEQQDLDLLTENSTEMTLNHLNMHENEVDVESLTSNDIKLEFGNEEVTPDVMN